jgi:hypothetical protein
LPHILV